MSKFVKSLRLPRGVPKPLLGGPSKRRGTGTLEHRLFVPDDVGIGQPAPLIVALHGCNQTAADFAVGTRFDRVAAQYGAVVLYPQQNKAANGSGCWNWFLPQHQTRYGGEPTALLNLVDEVKKRHPIDPDRVYVVGLSAGGAMAAILGEQAPDVFSGVGIAAGVALHASHDVTSAFAAMGAQPHVGQALPASLSAGTIAHDMPGLHPLVAELSSGLKPVMTAAARSQGVEQRTIEKAPTAAFGRMRVMIWTGTDDKTVTPRNATKLASQFADLLGIDASPSAGEATRSDVAVSQWRDGAGRSRIQVWTVRGMGHAWSGGSGQGSFTYPEGPDASTEMLRFLSATPSERTI